MEFLQHLQIVELVKRTVGSMSWQPMTTFVASLQVSMTDIMSIEDIKDNYLIAFGAEASRVNGDKTIDFDE